MTEDPQDTAESGRTAAPDGELLERIQAGDPEAAHTLFARYFPLLRSQVRRSLPAVLRRKVGESDVIQEAYLAVLQRLHDFEDRGGGSFEAWLRTVVDHKATDQIRRYLGTAKRDAGRERSHADGVAGRSEPGSEPTPATWQPSPRLRRHSCVRSSGSSRTTRRCFISFTSRV